MKDVFHRAGIRISACGAFWIVPLEAGLKEQPIGLEGKR